jgi:hypothetical protein
VRSSASTFNLWYLVFSRSSSSCLRPLPRLPITSILPFVFPSVTYCRRQFLRKTWPIHLVFFLFVFHRRSALHEDNYVTYKGWTQHGPRTSFLLLAQVVSEYYAHKLTTYLRNVFVFITRRYYMFRPCILAIFGKLRVSSTCTVSKAICHTWLAECIHVACSEICVCVYWLVVRWCTAADI